MAADICVVLTRQELQALYQAGPECWALYIVLRSMMDFDSGTVGLRSAISRAGLCRELETATLRGRGVEVTRPTEKMLDGYIAKLKKRGLLQRVGGEDVLVFLLPMAYRASVRPFHTGEIEGKQLSTEQVTLEASAGAALNAIGGTLFDARKSPMRGHIRVSGCTPSQSSSTDSTGVDASGDAGAGVNRDRPAGSQAGSLGRPGKTHPNPNRDRAAPSHPAPARRSAAGPDTGGAQDSGHGPTTARGSAENDSFADGMLPDAAAPLLRAVLAGRGIRVGAVEEPQLTAWAQAGVSPDELAESIDKARAARIKADSIQPIPLAYVAKVLASQRAAARRAAARLDGDAPRAWRGGSGDLAALAQQLGIAGARPGEEVAAFRDRVRAAWLAHNGDSHGPA